MKTFCPYRICSLGAHVDHQYGVVCGSAIQIGITFEYDVVDSTQIILSSTEYEGTYTFDMKDSLSINQDWADYFRGVIEILKQKYTLTQGLKGTFKGDLPSGGISSSSASQIAFLTAIIKINHIVLTKDDIIDIVYHVEHDFMKLNVGILDPSCEVLSRRNSLLFLDTLTNYNFCINIEEFDNKYQFII